MHVQTIPLEQTGQFSGLFLDYIQQKSTLAPLYHVFPQPAQFKNLIESRSFPASSREVLRNVLREQYAAYPPLVHTQIDTLPNPKTFTVTTGHQLNIFGGPMFLIYKLATAINLAKRLQQDYPDYHFVPVYWMATEDHDFDEINHFHLFGQKHSWQTEQKGAVGRMKPEELKTVFENIPEKLAVFEKAYLEHKTLAEATRCWVHELFGDQGLLCLDADAPALKAQFREVMHQDMFEGITFQTVNETTAQLSELGYKTQVNPREINFFYLDDQIRERIVQNGDGYEVLTTGLTFSAEALRKEIAKHPEKFSPNVMLRPVYQEMILPNLAYIGGPAEVSYWLQLKGLFDRLHVPFPALMPRNFGLIINKTVARKLNKLCLPIEDYFLDEVQLKRNYIACAVPEPVQVDDEKELIRKAFETLLTKAVRLDKTLEGFVGAERQRTLNILENVEKRLKKAEEKNQETGIGQLLSIKSKLFPEGKLQERVDNFLTFYLNDPRFLKMLLQTFDPFEYRFYILSDND